MQLIIIGGQAGVGKTALAHLIAEQAFELGFIPVVSSFAAALKKAAAEAGCSKEEKPEEYRKFCQTHGAEKRKENPDYWVEAFNESLTKIVSKEKRDLNNNERYWERCVIVDDCRYPNEVRYAMKKKATTLFLMYGDRPNPNRNKEWTKHESEELANTICKNPDLFGDAFQYFIYNDMSLGDLKEKVDLSSPFWCGVQADPDAPQKLKQISKCISELIDLLLLNALEQDDTDYDFKEGSD